MLSLWEVLKASKGLPASDGFTALFAEKLTGIVSEISGIPPLNLAKVKDVVDYTIRGNTVQNGTPTPDNPVEVHAVGDRTGNLFDIIPFKVTFETGSTVIRDFLNSLSTGTYMISYNAELLTRNDSEDSSIYGIRVINESGNFELMPSWGSANIGTVRKISLKITITEDNKGKFTKVYFYGCGTFSVGVTGSAQIYDFMLNLGTEPLPYEPYGYRIPVETRGKNLLEITEDNSIYYGVLNGYTINDNKVHVTGQSLLGFKAEVQPNTTYTIQRKRTPSVMCDFRIREYSAEPTEWMSNHILQSVNTTSDTVTFATSTETKWVLVTIYVAAKQEAFTIYDVQLELGSTATEYEPYHEPITTPIYLDKPLYKIGDYADSINYAEQKAERVVKELVLTGEENWVLQSINNNGIANFFIIIANGLRDIKLLFSTHFIAKTTMIANTATEGLFIANNVDGIALYVRIKQERASTATLFKAFLAEQYSAGTPVTVYYVLAEPETESVTLPKIPTLDGTTVIDVETEIEPSNMYIKYKSRR